MKDFVAMPPYPWMDSLWQDFSQRVTSGRLAHALLFVGSEGLGLESFTQAAAQLLLCSAPVEDIACGQCRACKLILAGAHPDLKTLDREEGATQLKIDQIREVAGFVSTTPQYDGRKVVRIPEAELMNVSSANALLKSLEEPAGDSVFLLSTTRLSSLLPTIRSRCQIYTLDKPSRAQSLQWLEKRGLENAEYWLDLSAGLPLRALQWSDGDLAEKREKLFQTLLSLVTAEQHPLQVAQVWKALDAALLFEWLLQACEYLIRDFSGAAAMPEDMKELGAGWSFVDIKHLFELRDAMLQRKREFFSASNLSDELIKESLALDWFALARRGRRQASGH